jgi:fucose 4-O-acetylase-like acetyltransferase
MGKNKTRSKSALKQNSVTAENKRLGDDGNINFTFKILSAIGIIIIVSGHCYNGGVSLMYDWFPKYSYNLALFVFISGYFYKEKHEEHIFKYIWGRTKRLLIPAYLWNIVYGIIAFALTQVGYTIAQGKFDLYNLFVMPFIDGESFAYNLGSWYIRCSAFMFLTYCSANCSKRFTGATSMSFLPCILQSEFSVCNTAFGILPQRVRCCCCSGQCFFCRVLSSADFIMKSLKNTIISTALHILQSFSEFSFLSSHSVKILNTLRQSA